MPRCRNGRLYTKANRPQIIYANHRVGRVAVPGGGGTRRRGTRRDGKGHRFGKAPCAFRWESKTTEIIDRRVPARLSENDDENSRRSLGARSKRPCRSGSRAERVGWELRALGRI